MKNAGFKLKESNSKTKAYINTVHPMEDFSFCLRAPEYTRKKRV